MKWFLKALLLSTAVLGSVAQATLPGALVCHAPDPTAHGTVIHHFDIPDPGDSLIAPDFGDLTGTGIPELVQPGKLRGSFDLGTVAARQRVGTDDYHTRAILAFPGERILAVKILEGAVVSIDEPKVVLVASMAPAYGLRLRYVRGGSWQVERVCDGVGAYHYAQFAPVSTGGDMALYTLSTTAVSIHSVIDGTLIRSIDLPDRNVIAVGQLDNDPALEIVADGIPGVVVDAVSGTIEWSHPPGFGRQITMGNAQKSGGRWLAASEPFSNTVTVFSTAPFAASWTIPFPPFSNNLRQITAYDATGDGVDELLVTGEFVITITWHTNETRIYDVQTQTVFAKESRPNYVEPGLLTALPGRTSMLPEIMIANVRTFPHYLIVRFTHPFGLVGDGHEEWTQYGPFSAFTEGDFNDDSEADIGYSGRTNEGLTQGGPLHVLARADWSSVWSMPTAYTPEYYLFPQVFDVANVRSPYGPGRLLITAGRKTDGTLAAIDGLTHSVRWVVGALADGSSPFGSRIAERIAIGDTDNDGEEDILVAASSGDSNPNIGVRLYLFSSTGTELWRSQELPPPGEIRALKLQEFGNGRTPVALLTTNAGTFAFELPGQTPIWTLPTATVAIQPLPSGGYAVLNSDCSVSRLDGNRQVLWHSAGRDDCAAIYQPIAGGPLLIATGSVLRWINTENGVQISVSAPLMPGFALGNRWTVTSSDNGMKVRITAGGDWGLMDVEIPVPSSDIIFADTFE